METSPFKFRATSNIHNGVVDAVEQEQVSQVRVNFKDSRAIALELDAPVENDGIAGDRESEDQHGQHVDRHA